MGGMDGGGLVFNTAEHVVATVRLELAMPQYVPAEIQKV